MPADGNYSMYDNLIPGTVGRVVGNDGNYHRWGFFCLTGEDTGVTAAHILEGTKSASVYIGSETYQITSWRQVRPQSQAPESDLAEITLDRAPPKILPRWQTSTSPPAQKNFEILVDRGTHTEWTTLAPRALWGQQVAALMPSDTFAVLRTLAGKESTSGPLLTTGDSGGPWMQDGKLVAVTSRISGANHGIIQTAYGSGLWEDPAIPWPPPATTTPIWLFVTLIVLLLAKLLAKIGKKP